MDRTGAEVIGDCPLYAGLPREELEGLARVAERHAMRTGDLLWRSGARPLGFLVLGRGGVKLVQELPTGMTALLTVFGAPESAGDVAAMQDVPYPATCVALTDGFYLRLPRATVLDLAQRQAELQRRLAEAPMAHIRRLHQTVATLHAGNIEARLASALLDLAARLGRKRDDGVWVVPAPLSRQELADLVSARIESVIRAMSRWGKEGLVETRVTGFAIVNLEALEHIAGHAMAQLRPASSM